MVDKPNAAKSWTTTGLIAMAVAATPVYTGWEGTKNLPYKDIVGVWTVCSGDTRDVVPGQRQTDAQCAERTQSILKEFGAHVADSSPGISDSRLQWEAHTIFAANVGLGAYDKSSVRRLYNANKHRDACRAMLLYDKAGGRVATGLHNRRAGTDDRVGEYELCLGGAVSEEY